jgi:hypothetical protein
MHSFCMRHRVIWCIIVDKLLNAQPSHLVCSVARKGLIPVLVQVLFIFLYAYIMLYLHL